MHVSKVMNECLCITQTLNLGNNLSQRLRLNVNTTNCTQY